MHYRSYNGYIVGEVDCQESSGGNKNKYDECIKKLIARNPAPYQPGNDPTTRWIGSSVNVGGQEVPILYIAGAIALVALLLILK